MPASQEVKDIVDLAVGRKPFEFGQKIHDLIAVRAQNLVAQHKPEYIKTIFNPPVENAPAPAPESGEAS